MNSQTKIGYVLENGVVIPASMMLYQMQGLDENPDGPVFKGDQFSHWGVGGMLIPSGWFEEHGIEINRDKPWFRQDQDRLIFLNHLSTLVVDETKEGDIRYLHSIFHQDGLFQIYHGEKWYNLIGVSPHLVKVVHGTL